jgi:hypothetical protein
VSTRSPDDGELEALLARGGRLARAWREASREEPPAALDDAMRAAARRAVHAGPRVGRGPFGGRWRVPLSIAAVLVVSATLTLLVAERREHVPNAGLDAAPAAPPAAAPSAAAPPAEDRKLAEPHALEKDTALSQGNAASPRKRSAAQPAQSLGESRTELYDAPAEASGTIAQEAPPAEASGTVTQEAASETPAPPAAGLQARPAAATPSPSSAEPAVPAAEASSADAQAGKRDVDEVKKGPQPEAFPGREQARADTRAKSRMETGAGELEKHEPPGAGSPAQRAGEPARDPKTWLERILALRREGKLQEAERSLQEFRRRYPDYPLPPELARLAPGSAPAEGR